MALSVDLEPGDMLVVPPDSGAQIRIAEKSGRRTRLAINSAKPVEVLRGRDRNVDGAAESVRRPATQIHRPGRPVPAAK